MTEQRYSYATVGITEEKDVPAVLLGKKNATFEIAGMEYDRTAILRLPEKMNQTEFDAWKESGEVDLIDMFFHCIHQKSVRPESGSSSGSDDEPTDGSSSNEESEESASGSENGPNRTLTDGGEPLGPSPEEIEHRMNEARKQLGIIKEKAEGTLPTAAGYLSGILDDLDTADEMLNNEQPVNASEPVTDGGSSMPKLALEHLKELKEVDERLGELLSEMTGEELDSFAGIYQTEQSIPEANNDIELGEGFSLKETEFVELLGMLEQGRAAAADDPIPLGVRNRLLMNLILANPEEYARIKAEEAERQREAQEKARQRFNEAVGRKRMNERMADLNDGVDIPIDDEEETGQ